MNTEKLNINFAEGEQVKELIIRETGHVNEPLPIQEPDPVNIVGTITAPYNFLAKRYGLNQFDTERTHVIVDRDAMSVRIVINETDKRYRMTVVGKIELSRQFRQFGINAGKMWEPEDMGNFFRINRTYFESKEEAMKLVSLLKSFKARISTEVEREKKDNGSVTDVYRKVVDSNIPSSFIVRIPVYKGAAPERIEIEVAATVNGRDVSLELISPDAQSIVETVRDNLINEELGRIAEFAPELPIIEV